MKKFFTLLGNFDYYAQVIFMAGLLITLILQILYRFLPSLKTPWTLEVISFNFSMMIWFGIGIGVKDYSHVGITFLLRKFSPFASKVIFSLHLGLFFFFLGFIIYWGGVQLGYYYRAGTRFPASQLLYWVVRSPMVIGGIYSLGRIVEKIYRVWSGEDTYYLNVFSGHSRGEEG